MHGNVWEWTRDSYAKDWYSQEKARMDPLRNPLENNLRVFRGGSWEYGVRHARSAYRSHVSPGFRYRHLGFRTVLQLDGRSRSCIPGGPAIVLEAKHVTARQMKYDRHQNILHYWTDGQSAGWKRDIPPGRYAVSAYLSHGESSDSFVTVKIGKEKVSGKVFPTGDWNRWRRVEFGIVHLKKPEKGVLIIGRARKGWVGNLRKVLLTPLLSSD